MLARSTATAVGTASLGAMSTSLGRPTRALLRAASPAALAVALALTPTGPATASAAATVGGEQLSSTGIVVDAPAAEALPDLDAASWLLADLETGEVLAARDPHGRLRPASTLKILTALTVLPDLDPAATYVARFEDANAEGSKVGMVPDATYSVHNLFEAMFLVSGNDAAHALATAAGGVKQTVDRMNALARDLGALDTKAVNPSGLDAPGQLTSAYDLAVIARAAMAREDFRAYALTVKSQFPGAMPRAGKARKTYEIYTQDRLLLNYRGAVGIKTGWTTKARGTFVGAATRGGRTLVATVLQSNQDAWRESAALLTWGFRNAADITPVGTLDAVPEQVRQAGPDEPTVAEVPAKAVTTAGSGDGLPWWLQVPLVLLAVVVLLRARVLLRRRLRAARRHPPARDAVPQPRDRRRDRPRASTVVAAAPRPAPTMPARQRPGATAPGEDAGTSSASTGTAS